MKSKNKYYLTTFVVFMMLLVIAGFNVYGHKSPVPVGWCNKPLRPELKNLKEIKTHRSWFKIYDVGNHTYAIDEPYNYEETIAYLIIGKNKALLFDTGMGLDSISAVVKELTKLPIMVLNSHTHPDHVGGNNEFSHILAMNTPFTHANAKNGYKHNEVKAEVDPSSFCLARLPRTDTTHYAIKPFKVAQYINDGYIINLGGRKLQVIATPGHTPDAICLFDKQAGYLWTGDSFYQGPIFLLADHTDLKAYHKSIHTIARYAALSHLVLPAHNLPAIEPAMVIAASKHFDQIATGKMKGKPGEYNSVLFDCGKFSFQISKKAMAQLGQKP